MSAVATVRREESDARTTGQVTAAGRPSGSGTTAHQPHGVEHSIPKKQRVPLVKCPYSSCLRRLKKENLEAHVQEKHLTKGLIQQLGPLMPSSGNYFSTTLPLLTRLIREGACADIHLRRHVSRNRLSQLLEAANKNDPSYSAIFMTRVGIAAGVAVAETSMQDNHIGIVEVAYRRAATILGPGPLRTSMTEALCKCIPESEKFDEQVIYSYVSRILTDTVKQLLLDTLQELKVMLKALPQKTPEPGVSISGFEAAALHYINGFQIKRAEKSECKKFQAIGEILRKEADLVPAQVKAFSEAQNRGGLVSAGEPLRRLSMGVYAAFQKIKDPREINYGTVLAKVKENDKLATLWENIFEGSNLSKAELQHGFDVIMKGLSITFINGFIGRERNISDDCSKDSQSLRSRISR
ncbi:hypothetical protein ONE63_003377 [Megalurothrips usitatus]|uniref:Uncharacterized protein n=1 Tax=Megalurothrips usitatus TaxID=439358 RepID=A0AAV7X7V5_9NEOP|nr:hypothetical protein ONE63_003377 [Megalurothrips usitatus]